MTRKMQFALLVAVILVLGLALTASVSASVDAARHSGTAVNLINCHTFPYYDYYLQKLVKVTQCTQLPGGLAFREPMSIQTGALVGKAPTYRGPASG